MIPIEELPPISRPPDLVEERVLTAEEIQKFIKPIYDEGGFQLPDPATSVFVGVVEGGEVLAFLGLQVMLHAEPLWIKDGKASYLTSLVHSAERVILERAGPQWVYLFAPAGKIARLAEHLGMRLEPWCVYSKLVLPSTPVKPMTTLVDEDAQPVDGVIN